MKQTIFKFAIWLGLGLALFGLILVMAPQWEEWNHFSKPHSEIPCVSYTPFRGAEAPWQLEEGLKITDARFRYDLSTLYKAGTRCVRTYAVSGLDNFFPVAREMGFEVWMGVWINADLEANEKELEKARAILADFGDVVRLVIVGNEVLLRHELQAQTLEGYIRRVKAWAPDKTVTYADVWEYWQKNPSVAAAVDLIAIHILPYWENDPIPASGTREHILKIYDGVAAQFAPKPVALAELGWPSRGRSREGAVAGAIEQSVFVTQALSLCAERGWLCNFIEAFDQPWKRRQEGGVGGSWGLWDEQRRGKSAVWLPEDKLKFAVCGALGGVIAAFAGLSLRGRRFSLADGLIGLAACVVTGIVSGLSFSDYRFYARSVAEGVWFGFLWLLPLAFCTLTFEKRFSDQLRRWALLALSFALLTTALALAVDGRYRFFPNETFLLLTLFVVFWRWQNRARPSLQTPFLSAALSVCGVLLLKFETVSNVQAVVFVGCVFTTAFALGRPRCSRADALATAFLACLALAGYALRVFWLQSETLGALCADAGAVWHCQLRSAVGFLIYKQVWGAFALLGLLATLLCRKRFVFGLAAMFSILALAFYNVDAGAYALAALLAVSWFSPPPLRGRGLPR